MGYVSKKIQNLSELLDEQTILLLGQVSGVEML